MWAKIYYDRYQNFRYPTNNKEEQFAKRPNFATYQNPPTSCSTSSAVGRSQAITGGADGAGNGAGSGPGGGGGGGKIQTRCYNFER